MTQIQKGYSHKIEIVVISYKFVDQLLNFVDFEGKNIKFFFYSDLFLPIGKSLSQLNTPDNIQPSQVGQSCILTSFEFNQYVSNMYLQALSNKIMLKTSLQVHKLITN